MSLPKRVVLVGPMGAGKSTIGRMLAKELGYRFLDSDRIIEERCGANIPWIFDVEGEDGLLAVPIAGGFILFSFCRLFQQ